MKVGEGSRTATRKKREISSISDTVQSENMTGVVTRSQNKRRSVSNGTDECRNSAKKSSRTATKTETESSRRRLFKSNEEVSRSASKSSRKNKPDTSVLKAQNVTSPSSSTSVSRVRKSSRNANALILDDNDDDKNTTPNKKTNMNRNTSSRKSVGLRSLRNKKVAVESESETRSPKKPDKASMVLGSPSSSIKEREREEEEEEMGTFNSFDEPHMVTIIEADGDKRPKTPNETIVENFETTDDKVDGVTELDNEVNKVESSKKKKHKIKQSVISNVDVEALTSDFRLLNSDMDSDKPFQADSSECLETEENNIEDLKEEEKDQESIHEDMVQISNSESAEELSTGDKVDGVTELKNEVNKMKSSKKKKHKIRKSDVSNVDTEAFTYDGHQLNNDTDSNNKPCQAEDWKEEEKDQESSHEDIVQISQSESPKKLSIASPRRETDSSPSKLVPPSRNPPSSESTATTTKRKQHSPKMNSSLTLKTQMKSESSDSDSDAESRKAIMESAQKRIIQNISTSESESRKFVKPLAKSSKQKMSSDSDSAPESMSFSAGRKIAMDSLKNAVEGIQMEKQRRKEKRKQRLEKYKQQKEETLIRLKEKRASQEDASCSSSEESGYEEEDMASAFGRKNESKKQGTKREKENLDDVPQSKIKKFDSDGEAVPKERKEKKRKYEHKEDSGHYGSLKRLDDDVLENLPDQLPVKVSKLESETISKHESQGKHKRLKDKQQNRDFRNRTDVDYIPLTTYGTTEFGVMPLDTLKKAPKSMAEQAAEFRKKMLFGSHIKRLPANAQAVYQQKLKASGKDAFVR